MLIAIEILVIVLLVLFNGMLALAEAAVITSRKTLLEKWAQKGNVGATVALRLVSNITGFLSSVQVGITLLGIVAGVFSGATISMQLAESLSAIEALRPYAPEIAFAIIVLVVTAASVLFGELVPKRLALKNPERVASLVSRPVYFFTRLTYPLAKALSAATELIVLRTSRRLKGRSPVSEEEVRMIIDQGIAAGVFEQTERDIIERVFRVGDLAVNELMVHRTEVIWLPLDASPEGLQSILSRTPRAQYPVCEGTIDQVIGVMALKDILIPITEGRRPDLRERMREPLFLPETMPALRALDQMVATQTDNAIVVDEFGGTAGLVRLQDIARAFVGERRIFEELPLTLPERKEDGTIAVEGRTPLHLLAQVISPAIDMNNLPPHVQTVGGLIMNRLGRVPHPGDEIVVEAALLTVLSMRGNRVGRVLITDGAKREDPVQETAPRRKE